MKNIVVTNLYGKFNLGDNAIRNSGLDILDEAIAKKNVFLLCESDTDFPIQTHLKEYQISFAPYGYAIRANAKPLNKAFKFYRFFQIFFISLLYLILGFFSYKFLPTNGFYKYILWIKNSDVVVAMGGGYLITSIFLTDFFGILLNLLPIYAAKIYKKKIIFLPMSFGPFAHKIDEQIVGSAVKNSIFLSREEISTNIVSKFNKKVTQIPDLALLDWKKNANGKKENYFVLTFRESLDVNPSTQNSLEKEVSKFITYVFEKYGYTCVFIPMASNPIEENDLIVAKAIQSHLEGKSYFIVLKPTNPEDAKLIISKARFSVCNRLHSAIFSATVFTPFITISYAHKTIGFLKMLGLDSWNIPMKEISFKDLVQKFELLNEQPNYDAYIHVLEKEQTKISASRQEMLAILKHEL